MPKQKYSYDELIKIISYQIKKELIKKLLGINYLGNKLLTLIPVKSFKDRYPIYHKNTKIDTQWEIYDTKKHEIITIPQKVIEEGVI